MVMKRIVREWCCLFFRFGFQVFHCIKEIYYPDFGFCSQIEFGLYIGRNEDYRLSTVLSGVSHHTTFHRQGLDFVIQFSVIGIDFTYLAQQCYLSVYTVLYVAVEQCELLYNFLSRIDLRIFAERGMEALQFYQSILIELYFLISLTGRIEHIIIDMRCGRTDTVYTSYALHKSCGIPWGIVIDYDIGAMEVYTFCKYIRSQDDIIPASIRRIIGIKVFLNALPQAATVGSRYHKNVVTA